MASAERLHPAPPFDAFGAQVPATVQAYLDEIVSVQGSPRGPMVSLA